MQLWFYFSIDLADNYHLRFWWIVTTKVTNSQAAHRFTLLPVLIALLSLFLSSVCFGQDKAPAALALHECWQYETTDLDVATAVSDGSNLYFGERGGRVSAISAEDGKRLWVSEIGGDLVSNFLLLDHELKFVARSSEVTRAGIGETHGS